MSTTYSAYSDQVFTCLEFRATVPHRRMDAAKFVLDKHTKNSRQEAVIPDQEAKDFQEQSYFDQELVHNKADTERENLRRDWTQ